jgi:hypothetical protein
MSTDNDIIKLYDSSSQLDDTGTDAAGTAVNTLDGPKRSMRPQRTKKVPVKLNDYVID